LKGQLEKQGYAEPIGYKGDTKVYITIGVFLYQEKTEFNRRLVSLSQEKKIK